MNNNYWDKRVKHRDKTLLTKENKTIRRVNRIYKEILVDIEKELSSFLLSYSEDNKLTLSQVNKILTPIEYSDYRKQMDKLINDIKNTSSKDAQAFIRELMKELKSRTVTTKQQVLADGIKVRLAKYNIDAEEIIGEHIEDTLRFCYSDTMESLGIQSAVIPDSVVREILNTKWSGMLYSKRIWKNSNKLHKFLMDDFVKHIIRGSSIDKMARDLMKKMNVGMSDAERLIRTESNFFHNQGTMQSYKDRGITEYKYLAYLDNRTTETCEALNGSIFQISQAKVGVNYPPMHVNCRSTTVPLYIDLEQKYLKR